MATAESLLVKKNFEVENQENVVMVLLKPLDSEVRILEPVFAFQEWASHKVKWYEESLPSVVAKHGAVMVFGKIFDFSENGLSFFPPSESSQFNEHLKAGKTKKSESEFHQWILSHGNKYTKWGYRMGTNNCLYFVSHACEFLGVKIPPEVQLIINWLERHWGIWAGALDGTQVISGGLNCSAIAPSSSSTPQSPLPPSSPTSSLEGGSGVANSCKLQ